MLKKFFFLGLTVLSNSITCALNCISMNNQKYKVSPEIVDVSSNNPIFYPFSVKINRCSVIVIVLMILMQGFAVLMLQKI